MTDRRSDGYARFGRYEVVCKLGEGAMAAVFLARDPVLTRSVAIKVLHQNVATGKTVLQRFFNEAKTVANVRNPHVVEVFDFGREGSEYYLVMEFVDGLSLQGVLKQLRPGHPGDPAGAGPSHQPQSGEALPDILTAALLCQAAEGLDIAGRHGVVHRDIKPENLMINQQGYMKIADFGIAHLQDESLTRTGAVLGSPLYMSPEQVRGAKPITSQSDMFSMGAVLYRCITGRPPFTSATLKDLYFKIAREPHADIRTVRPDLDPSLAGLVETLLRKDPAHRGGGPRWMRAELRAYLLSQGVDDPTDRVCRHLRELARRGIQTTWRLGPQEAVLPRTVAATSPMDHVAAPRPGYALPRTVQDGDGSIRESRKTLGRPKASRPVFRALAALMLATLILAAFTLAGIYLIDPDLSVRFHAGAARKDGRVSPPEPRVGLQAPAHPVGPAPATGTRVKGLRMGEEPRQQDVPPVPSGKPAAGTTSLLVQSSPPFAKVFLDGRAMGVTPIRLPDMVAGPHRLLIQGRSGLPMDTILELPPERITLKVHLDPGAIAFETEE